MLDSYITAVPDIHVNENGELILTCSDEDLWYPVSKYSFEIDQETGDLIITREDDE